MRVRKELPTNHMDLLIRVGMHEVSIRNLEQVKRAQHRLAELVLEAAEERWPDILSRPDHERIAWENARGHWPYIDSLVDALKEAERGLWRDSGACA